MPDFLDVQQREQPNIFQSCFKISLKFFLGNILAAQALNLLGLSKHSSPKILFSVS